MGRPRQPPHHSITDAAYMNVTSV
eukprot:COSAG02_NODE_35904_length_461_cov_13.825967_1_plen_23_part_01